MRATDRDEILDALRRGSDALLVSLRGVTEEMATASSGPGRWTILQCLEHLAISEEFLYSKIMEARPSEVPLVNKEREARIVRRGADRSNPVPSPEVGLPRGRFSTLEEALQGFLAARARTMEYAENCTDDLRSLLTTHPLIPGPVNCYEILLIIAIHPHRHAEQIRETLSG